MRRVRRRPSKYSLDCASLFAGVGGFDVAAEACGVLVRSWSEFDPALKKTTDQPNQRVMAKQFPNAEGFGDVAGVTYRMLGYPRMITAGTPCQGFSLAGLRAGMSDPRSGLFGEFVRIRNEGHIAGLLEYAVWENVPGALSSGNGEDFANVLAAMVGWHQPLHLPKFKTRRARWAGVAMGPFGFFTWRTLDAKHFGVAQRRRRIFGVWTPTVESVKILLGPEGREWIENNDPDVEPTAGVAVWCMDEGMPFNTGMAPDDPVETRISAVLEWGVDEKYYLSQRACEGIVRRAGRRGRALPEILNHALQLQANPPEGGGVPVLNAFETGHEWWTNGNMTESGTLNESDWREARQVVVEAVPFRKARRAHNTDDWETWEHDVVANTLNEYDLGKDIRSCDIVVEVPADVAATIQGGGDRGYRVDAEGAAGGHLVPVVGFTIDPEAGQGADLQARETTVSPALTANWLEKVTDRGLRLVEAVTYKVRRLTPLECERLQGFPDHHTLLNDSTDSYRYRQMGNAVAVPCAGWVIARIKASYDGREFPAFTDVLETMPWLRRESSAARRIVIIPPSSDSTKSVNGSRKKRGTSSRRVVRRSPSSWESTVDSRTSA